MLVIASLSLTLTACAPALTPVPTGTFIPTTLVPTSTSTEIPVTPTATLTVAREPPPCTFPLAQITTAESAPENYTFSEPKVVLTAPKGDYYHIAQWLPDNQRVLIFEELGNGVEWGKIIPESIELYNPVTNDTKVYATRPGTHESPSWLPQLKAVVYPVSNFLGRDQNTHQAKFTYELWISYGDPRGAQKLADNLSQIPIGVKPDGSEIVYLSDNKIIELNESLNAISAVPFDPTQWDYAANRPNQYPIRRDQSPVIYNMEWQPSTSLIFLYSEGNGGGGYTFILNVDTGQVCELNLGGFAFEAHWSSDGHYLAFIRSINYGYPTYSADLAVPDTLTGNLTVLSVIPQGTKGLHLVDDFVWAPDNRHLLAIGDIDSGRNSQDNIGPYLVDFVSGQSANILPAYTLYINSPQSMAWSLDGSKLVIDCYAAGLDKICIISVQTTGQ